MMKKECIFNLNKLPFDAMTVIFEYLPFNSMTSFMCVNIQCESDIRHFLKIILRLNGRVLRQLNIVLVDEHLIRILWYMCKLDIYTKLVTSWSGGGSSIVLPIYNNSTSADWVERDQMDQLISMTWSKPVSGMIGIIPPKTPHVMYSRDVPQLPQYCYPNLGFNRSCVMYNEIAINDEMIINPNEGEFPYCIALGIATHEHGTSMPGWYDCSIALHVDNAHVYMNGGNLGSGMYMIPHESEIIPNFKRGDSVIGFGYDPMKEMVFVTQDGFIVYTIGFKINRRIYKNDPIMVFCNDTRTKLNINYGLLPFEFPLQKYYTELQWSLREYPSLRQ